MYFGVVLRYHFCHENNILLSSAYGEMANEGEEMDCKKDFSKLLTLSILPTVIWMYKNERVGGGRGFTAHFVPTYINSMM